MFSFQFVFIATKGGSETGYIAVDQLEFKQTDECIFQVGYYIYLLVHSVH